MNIIIILLLLSILGFVAFMIREKIKDTLWYRTRQVFKHAEKRKKEEQKLLEKYEDNISEDEKKQMIHELKKKGNVKVPYAAFDYIYRHIDEFGIISKDGKIILTDEESYKRIINKTNKIDDRFRIKDKNNKLNSKTYFEVVEGDNGARVTKDHIANTITFETSKGDIFHTSGRNMVTIKHKEEEDKNKKTKTSKNNNSTPPENNSSKKEEQTSNNLTDKQNKSTQKVENQQESSKDKQQNNQNIDKLLESKALEALKKQQPKEKLKKQESKKDEFADVNINDIVNEIDDDSRFTNSLDTEQTEEENKNENEEAIEPENKEIELDEENNIQKTFDAPSTLKNFFQRKLYCEENLDSFYGSLKDEDIVDIIVNLFTFAEMYCQYPAIVKDNEAVYIDSSLFFLSIGKNIKKDDEDNFFKNIFKAKRINMVNATSLLKVFNDILKSKTRKDLFRIWKNQDNSDVCIIKRSFECDNKSYTSLMIILDTKALNSLRVDIDKIPKVELQDNIRGAMKLGNAIFERS